MYFHFRVCIVFSMLALAPAAPARADDQCDAKRAEANYHCMECQQAKHEYDEGQSALAKQIRKPKLDQKRSRFQLDMMAVGQMCKNKEVPCSECEE